MGKEESSKIYYQIDYIDDKGYANYINTYEPIEALIAQEHLEILNHANRCLNKYTKFTLNKYRTLNNEDDELIEENITKVESIYEEIERKTIELHDLKRKTENLK